MISGRKRYKVISKPAIGKLLDIAALESRIAEVIKTKFDELNAQQKEAIEAWSNKSPFSE